MNFEATKMRLSSAAVVPGLGVNDDGSLVDGGATISFIDGQGDVMIDVNFKAQDCKDFTIDVSLNDGSGPGTVMTFVGNEKRWMWGAKPKFWDDNCFKLVDRAQAIVASVSKG